MLSTRKLLALMVGAVLAVGALAFWDEERESQSALEDFAQEQATLASTVGTDLSTRLAFITRDASLLSEEGSAKASQRIMSEYLAAAISPERSPPVAHRGTSAFELRVSLPDERTAVLIAPSNMLVGGLHHSERPGAVRIFLQAPGEDALRGTDGGRVQAPILANALGRGQTTLRLSRDQAVALGLSERMAMAGFSHVDAGALGRWGVVVVASAERERDREQRARWRLILALGCASVLVLGFGGLALRKQRTELELAKQLELAELARERDEKLLRLSKAATTLTLASGFAHELATPLGVIVGRAEQLATRLAGDERGAKSAQVILEQAEGIHQVMRGFLNLAQGGPPSLVEVEPERVVAGAVALVQHRFERAQVRLSVEVPPGLPPVVCDLRLLEHALVNLLLNACDASPEGGRVEVRVDKLSEEITFAVTDEGAGIAPGDAARVTQPFFTTKPEGKGTGLGLAIANEIAKSHHGSLTLCPAHGQGTRASIQLPLNHGKPHARA